MPTVNELEAEYREKRKRYIKAGHLALGAPSGSKARADYEQAKRDYHRAGEELRSAKRRK